VGLAGKLNKPEGGNLLGGETLRICWGKWGGGGFSNSKKKRGKKTSPNSDMFARGENRSRTRGEKHNERGKEHERLLQKKDQSNARGEMGRGTNRKKKKRKFRREVGYILKKRETLREESKKLQRREISWKKNLLCNRKRKKKKLEGRGSL